MGPKIILGVALVGAVTAFAGPPPGEAARSLSFGADQPRRHALLLRGPELDRGVVQSVSVSALVLTELDGNTLTIPVDSSTQVEVNGKPGSLADVKAGFVVAVARPPNGLARVVRVLDPTLRARPQTDQGVLQSSSGSTLVVQLRDGSSLTVTVGPSTRVEVNGQPGSLADLKLGFLVTVQHRGAQALGVRALGRRR